MTLETMKLLKSAKSKIIKDENNENVPHLEITQLSFIDCNIVTTIISKRQEFYIDLFLINHLVNY